MAIVLDGTAGITTPDLTDTSLTSGRVVYAGTSGNLTGSSAFQFDGANVIVNATTPAYFTGTSNLAQISINRSPSTGTIFNASQSAAFINIDGASAGSSVQFAVASAANTQPSEQMRLISTGLGIGTTTPANPTGGKGLEVSNASGASVRITNSTTFLDLQSGSAANYILSNGAFPLVFYTNSAERFRVDSAGNFGIATSTPGTYAKFEVMAAVGGISAIFSDSVTGSARFHHASGSVRLSSDAALAFGAGSGGAERARIDTSGNLLVGTTDSSATSGNGLKVTAGSGNADSVSVVTGATSNVGLTTYQLYSTGAGAYRFYVGAGGTIFATSITISAISDQRLKENVRDIDTGLNAIMALKPRRFDWKDGKGQDKKDAAGFIAQEYRDIFPASVSETKAGSDGIEYLTMNHEELIPSLVKAIQEQQALITTLTERITALEGA